MKTNSEIRALARQSLSGNWTMPVLVMLILFIVSGISAIPYLGSLLVIFIFLPIQLQRGTVIPAFCTRREKQPYRKNVRLLQ